MYNYRAGTVWDSGRAGRIQGDDRLAIRVGTPQEFGGPAGVWSPEQLLVAAVDSCLMSTFLFFAERSGIKVHSYGSTTAGRMDKTPEGLRFTAMDVNIAVVVDENTDVDKARRLQSKLEKYCPVSTSLRCPVILYLKVAVREDHKDG